MPYKKQPQCLEWACWLVSYRKGQYPQKINLHNPIPCAGSFADSENSSAPGCHKSAMNSICARTVPVLLESGNNEA